MDHCWSRIGLLEKNASRSIVEKSKSQPISVVKSNISSPLPTLTLAEGVWHWRESLWKPDSAGKDSLAYGSGIWFVCMLDTGPAPSSTPAFLALVSCGIHSYEGSSFLRIVWILAIDDLMGSPDRMDERQCSVACIHGRCVGTRFSPCIRSYMRVKQALPKKYP